MNKDQHKTPSK